MARGDRALATVWPAAVGQKRAPGGVVCVGETSNPESTMSVRSSGSNNLNPRRSCAGSIGPIGLPHSGQAVRYVVASPLKRTRQWRQPM